MLGLSGQLDMLATLVMVAILCTVDMLCITALLAMGLYRMHRTHSR